MAFPQAGLPDVVSIRRYTVTGQDADDNPVYTPSVAIDGRKARFYRDTGKDTRNTDDGVVIRGVVTFKYFDGDVVRVRDEVLLTGPEFIETARFHVMYPVLKMLWSRPSHWEISLTEYV